MAQTFAAKVALLDTNANEQAQAYHAIGDALHKFDHVNEIEETQYALLKRFDTKFLVSYSEAVDFLSRIQSDYVVLKAESEYYDRYITHYFDTNDFECFQQHRRGIRPRYKIRTREYLNRRLGFFEIKEKNKYNQVTKTRIEITLPIQQLEQQWVSHLPPPLSAIVFEPQLKTTFNRAMLLSSRTLERLSIDWGLQFERGDAQHSLKRTAIIELKQKRIDLTTPARLALRDMFCHPTSMSKYCFGLTTLGAPVKGHLFKNIEREMTRIEQGRGAC